MLYLALFNGLTGFYNPLNSIIKSNILVEKYRALLMNLFRIPLNTYVIVVLLTLRYMNPFTVALIAGTMCYVATAIGIFLCIYLFIINKDSDKDKDKENDKLLSELMPIKKNTIYFEEPVE